MSMMGFPKKLDVVGGYGEMYPVLFWILFLNYLTL